MECWLPQRFDDLIYRIAVLHHDLEWLHESESGIREQMASAFDIMLMGHIHRESTVLKISPNNEVL